MDVPYGLNRLLASARVVQVLCLHCCAYVSDKRGDVYGEGVQQLLSSLRWPRFVGSLRLYKGNELGSVRCKEMELLSIMGLRNSPQGFLRRFASSP